MQIEWDVHDIGLPALQKLGDAFPEIVSTVAGLLGQAHRRAATAPVPAAWSAEEQSALLDGAIDIAMLHEGAWLAYSRRTKDAG